MKTFCLLSIVVVVLVLTPFFAIAQDASPDPGKTAVESHPAPAGQETVAADSSPAEQAAPVKDEEKNKELTGEGDGAGRDKSVKEDTSVRAQDKSDEEGGEEEASVADPLEPWNRLMFKFNDKLYFWVLKPAARGYNKVVPEGARISVSNFFYNITTPIRLVNSLLQLKIKEAGTEVVRLVTNSTLGMGGLFDIAKDWNLLRQDEDTGLTRGHYGMKEVFYIVWPFFGPSDVRDTIGTMGDGFLDPVDYVRPAEASLGVQAYERLNKTSLHLGEYEDMKESAIDPYIAVRDAYIQNRRYKIKGE